MCAPRSRNLPSPSRGVPERLTPPRLASLADPPPRGGIRPLGFVIEGSRRRGRGVLRFSGGDIATVRRAGGGRTGRGRGGPERRAGGGRRFGLRPWYRRLRRGRCDGAPSARRDRGPGRRGSGTADRIRG